MSVVATYTGFKASGINIWWLLLIIAISGVAVFAPVLVTAIWYMLIVHTVYSFTKNKMEYVWYGIAASPALEVWGRMAAAPLLPYEVGKYYLLLCIAFCAAHILLRKQNAPLYKTGWVILGALLPSLLVGLATFDMEQWVFNVFGILALGTLLIFASRERWHIERVCRTLQIALLSITALLIYISFKVPALSDINFSLKANASASGGFGSNQVATLLGMGMVFSVILILLKRPLFSMLWLNYALLAYMLFRVFLTFSRGGLLVAAIAILIALTPKIFESIYSFFKYAMFGLLLLLAGILIFWKVNDLTGNMLLLRYQGETYGTISGDKERSLNTILSGRQMIAASDLKIFSHHTIFGAGAGMSKELRPRYGYDIDVAPHTEYTRLLSEHGLGGLAVIIVLSAFPFYWVRRQTIPLWKGIVAALFALAILTTFHAAMRTNAAIVCYVLAALPVLYHKYTPDYAKGV